MLIEKTKRTDGTERFELHLGDVIHVISLAQGEKLARDTLSLIGIEVALLEDVMEVAHRVDWEVVLEYLEVGYTKAWVIRLWNTLAKLEKQL